MTGSKPAGNYTETKVDAGRDKVVCGVMPDAEGSVLRTHTARHVGQVPLIEHTSVRVSVYDGDDIMRFDCLAKSVSLSRTPPEVGRVPSPRYTPWCPEAGHTVVHEEDNWC